VRESAFWASVRKQLPRDLFVRRIEDASGNKGTWDTYMARSGRSGWIELKVAGPNAKLELRPGQQPFGQGLFDAGIPAAYLVGSDNGTVRLIGPCTDGKDWRDHVIARWGMLDMTAVLITLDL
jgi:hypothetical protein